VGFLPPQSGEVTVSSPVTEFCFTASYEGSPVGVASLVRSDSGLLFPASADDDGLDDEGCNVGASPVAPGK